MSKINIFLILCMLALYQQGHAQFVTTWKTDNPGTSTNTQITLPLESSGTYNFSVDWGDGTSDVITSFNQTEITHDYSTAGTYTVSITGTLDGWTFNNLGDQQKLTGISAWGPVGLGNSGGYFYGASNLVITATDAPSLNGMTNMTDMFRDCSSIQTVPGMENWNVSNITSMFRMFRGASDFNQDIGSWNVSNVTDMRGMLREAGSFNQDISTWNTGNVTSMFGMFQDATSFSQNLGIWDVTNVTSMAQMFEGVSLNWPDYNGILTGWAAQSVQSNVEFNAGNSRYTVASLAATARQNLINNDGWSISDGGATTTFVSTWKTDNTGTSSNTQISLPLESIGSYDFTVDWGDGTYDVITSYNQSETTHDYTVAGSYTLTIAGTLEGFTFNNQGDQQKLIGISAWGPVGLGNSGGYFYGASNLVITATDAPSLNGMTNMTDMFRDCSSIQSVPGLENWNVSNITSMFRMFRGASDFNQDIGSWNVSNVTDMRGMLREAGSFNQDISSWNTGNVTSMFGMFKDATSFSQNLGTWDVTNITSMAEMFEGVTLNWPDYNGILTGWAAQSVQSNVELNAGNSQYTTPGPGNDARQNLISNKGWTISDGGSIAAFISTWNTDDIGLSRRNQTALPLEETGTYNFTVDWGDGTSDLITSYNQPETTHTYPAEGIYTITIVGTLHGWSFETDSWGEGAKILEISNWGDLILGNSGHYFDGAHNLIITATDILDVSGVTDMSYMFSGCLALTEVPNMSNWDVSNVTDMSWMFNHANNFNQDLGNWEVGNVSDMSWMFSNAHSFNHDIGSWDVSTVTNMEGMFNSARTFNQDLNNWNVSNVNNMLYMFTGSSEFNGAIGNWNVSNVTSMYNMFAGAESFNQDIGNWNVGNVTNMNSMFRRAAAFNQDIGSWNMSNVTTMTTMFSEASSFNQDISSWNVSGVTSFSNLFANATSFNQDISSWNTANVTTMIGMFYGATAFDQNLAAWDVTKVTNMYRMFYDATLSTPNYDALLVGWQAQSVRNNISFDAGNSTYTPGSSAETARSTLINTNGWNITDGGVNTFISTWQTDNPGTSNDNQVTLPLVSTGTYDFTVDWGDGTSSTITSYNQPEVTHTYTTAGTYTVSMVGALNGWSFNDSGDRLKLIEISDWGGMNPGNTGGQFYGAANLIISAIDLPDLTGLTTLTNMFRDCSSITSIPNLAQWDLGGVINISGIFQGASNFDQDISAWDVSSVTDMSAAFSGATSFSQDLSDWDITSVTTMAGMFTNVTLLTDHYDAILFGWDNQTVQSSVTFDAGNSRYSGQSSAEIARTNLISNDSWTITDGGPDTFVSTWQTDNTGSSNDNQITLPLESTGTYNFTVNWGDGSASTITSYNQAEVTHTYATSGSYTVSITGILEGWSFNNTGDKLKITGISDWGGLRLGNSEGYFYGSSNLTISATTVLNTAGTTSLSNMFRDCSSLTTVPSLLDWDFSNIEDISAMFRGASSFNQAIGLLNVSSVTNLDGVFRDATVFNQDIGNWNVSNVTTMFSTFRNATAFDQDLSAWNVGKVTTLNATFYNATSFSQDLSAWDITQVSNMSDMFTGVTLETEDYNAILVGWAAQPVQSNVTFSAGNSLFTARSTAALGRKSLIGDYGWTITDGGRISTFVTTWQTDNAGTSNSNQITLPLESTGTYDFTVDWGDGSTNSITSYNQPEVTHTYGTAGTYTVTITGTLEGWTFNNSGDKLKLTEISDWGNLNPGNTGGHFYGCTNLIITAETWLNTTGMTIMTDMFRDCNSMATIPNIQNWNVSNITRTNRMFRGASLFDQDLSSWDMGNVSTVSGMFRSATSFNQDLSDWNLSNANTMFGMFQEATSFDQDISSWDVTSVTDMDNMFLGVTLSTTNYNAILEGWAAQSVQIGITLNAGNSQFTQGGAANVARTSLISQKGWTIIDGGSSSAFISKWTTNFFDQIKLPLESTGTYNFTVDWGDGTSSLITSYDQAEVTHTYASEGTYVLSITGTLDGWNFKNAYNGSQLQEVMAWGNLKLGNSGGYFWNCQNMIITATDPLDLTGVTDMSGMFFQNVNLSYIPNIESWDVSNVTNMNRMFEHVQEFNQDISGWNVSNVLDMGSMLTHTHKFNQDISGWNVSNVTDMSRMFNCAFYFDQDISGWNVGNVTNMQGMFAGTASFSNNGFNQDISSWNVSNVTNMRAMFSYNDRFNQDLNSWNVGNVTLFGSMFSKAKAFNGNISDWNVSNVTEMSSMFANASNFNQNLSNWNTVNVTDMQYIFLEASSFNQDISSWNTSNVTSLNGAFYGATAFDQNLSAWNISNVTSMSHMFKDVKLSTANYDALLTGWQSQTVQNNVTFDGGESQYTAGSTAETARTTLINTNGWTITDGGTAPDIGGTAAPVHLADADIVFDNESEPSMISLYPNPTTDVVNITGTMGETPVITLHTVSGRLVLVPKIDKVRGVHRIKLNGLENGIYLIRILDEGKTSTHRIIRR